MLNQKICVLYKELRKKHGLPQDQWSLWCARPKTVQQREAVIVGAILTQNTNWENVEKALVNLKTARKLSLRSIVSLRLATLAQLIKPAGYNNIKARYLKNVAEFFVRQGGVLKLKKQTEAKLRPQLLALKGVGPETADSILLYALDKPMFVIDEYTRRLVKKQRLVRNFNYEFLQTLFMNNLSKNYKLYQDFHALIVIDQKFQMNGQNSVLSVRPRENIKSQDFL